MKRLLLRAVMFLAAICLVVVLAIALLLYQTVEGHVPSGDEIVAYAGKCASDRSVCPEFVSANSLPPHVIAAFSVAERARPHQLCSVCNYLPMLPESHMSISVAWSVLEPYGPINQTLDWTVRRAWTAKVVEWSLEPEVVAEVHLSKAYFGRSSYGIRTAALSYFGQKPADLSIAESAALAALLKSPLYRKHTDKWLIRRNWVIQEMETGGFISTEAAQQAKQSPLEVMEK